eukprot:CAMPEP_0119056938 /NCGR_PEP_ID=MMETSP1178-20130426/1499_1 /TAXON_ID=33656 /ORGANISM="unid sp, Strain CCMP2000" /LENGTH=113 /DNA_ID=CAMNT_0007037721 /DNA_START=509 /DNA_END=850 /DNA_ORIENTATION=-
MSTSASRLNSVPTPVSAWDTMPFEEDEYMNESISVAASHASDASVVSFLASRTRLRERGPCVAQNFFEAGVSMVPSSTMMLPLVSIRIAQLMASAAFSRIIAASLAAVAAAAS